MSGRKRRVRLTHKNRVRLPSSQKVSPWVPKWENEIRGFTLNFIRENKWRCEGINDIEDLLQDSYILFLKISDNYPRVVDPPHFMSLYKTALRNLITDKARYYTRKTNLIDEGYSIDDNLYRIECSYNTVNDGEIESIIRNASPEMEAFLDLIKDDEALKKLREPQRTKKGEPRMNLNRKISKLLGIENYPFKQQLKKLLLDKDEFEEVNNEL